MKILFVTGCPRSGTTFYSMKVFQHVRGFYVNYFNYEPAPLHDAQYEYMHNKKNGFRKLEETFIKFATEQNISSQDWIVIKHPYFSFILPELLRLKFEKKILVIQRNESDVFTSRINFKDSLTQVESAYSCTWLHYYGLEQYADEWEKGDYKTRMKIYIQAQKMIEEKNINCCIQVKYGEDLVNNSDFIRDLNIENDQIMQLHSNFLSLWKNTDYVKMRDTVYHDAEEYKLGKNLI